MNRTTRLFAASALALIGTTAFAVEGEQPSTWMTTSSFSRTEAAVATQNAVSSLTVHEGSGTVLARSSDAVKRVQVVAEAREAQRLGLLTSYDGYGRQATASENEQIRRAGLRAVATSYAAK